MNDSLLGQKPRKLISGRSSEKSQCESFRSDSSGDTRGIDAVSAWIAPLPKDVVLLVGKDFRDMTGEIERQRN